MKPQTEAFLEKANELLSQAETMLSVGLTDATGRTAYLAGFHAAQGFLFEQADKAFKTHRGVQSEFNRLVKDDPRFDLQQRAFLGKTYDLKAIADYETGPGSKVSEAQAIARSPPPGRSWRTSPRCFAAGKLERAYAKSSRALSLPALIDVAGERAAYG